MNERAIKDLCIAWEALSRIPGAEALELAHSIRDQISNMIGEHTPKPIRKHRQTELDDEIPF